MDDGTLFDILFWPIGYGFSTENRESGQTAIKELVRVCGNLKWSHLSVTVLLSLLVPVDPALKVSARFHR